MLVVGFDVDIAGTYELYGRYNGKAYFKKTGDIPFFLYWGDLNHWKIYHEFAHPTSSFAYSFWTEACPPLGENEWFRWETGSHSIKDSRIQLFESK